MNNPPSEGRLSAQPGPELRALRVAVIGYGYGGRTLHVPIIRATHEVEVALVVTSQPWKVEEDYPELRTSPDFEDALTDEIDLVVIVTPNASHAPLAEVALRAGKHVVVDKPFTVTSAEAAKLIRIAADEDRILSVFHSRRWDADYLAIREIIDSGRLGFVSYVESRIDRYRPAVRDRWREQATPGAGIWYDLGSHLLDQAVQLFGRPEAIAADIFAQREGALVDDYFHATLFYQQRRVILHSTCLAVGNARRFIVHGSEGSYLKDGMDPQEAMLQAHKVSGGATIWGADPNPGMLFQNHPPEPITYSGPTGDYRRFYSGVAAAIMRGEPNPVPACEAAFVVKLIEAGLESSKNRATISLS